MLIECSKCGGPLDAKPGSRTAKCNYCGASNRTSETRTIAAVTPPGWAPPKVWMPPPGMSIQGRALVYKAGTAIAGFTLAMFLLPLIAMCAIFALTGGLVWMLAPSPAPGTPWISGPGVAQVTWNGATPLSCVGNEEMTFRALTVSLPGQTAISAGGNCRITLIACTITAGDAITASGNAHVTLQGGSVTATGVALTTTGNARISVQGTRVDGPVSAGSSGQITGVL